MLLRCGGRSAGVSPWDAELSQEELALQDYSRNVYATRLQRGVAREQARKDLPLSTYTEAYWKLDLHNLFHFLLLRMDVRAQYEIRQYACTIGKEIVSKWCPIAWEAFVDHRLQATEFSAKELAVLRGLLKSPEQARAAAIKIGLLGSDGTVPTRSREGNGCIGKSQP